MSALTTLLMLLFIGILMWLIDRAGRRRPTSSCHHTNLDTSTIYFDCRQYCLLEFWITYIALNNELRGILLHICDGIWSNTQHFLFRNLSCQSPSHLLSYMQPHILDEWYHWYIHPSSNDELSQFYWCIPVLCHRLHFGDGIRVFEGAWNKKMPLEVIAELYTLGPLWHSDNEMKGHMKS